MDLRFGKLENNLKLQRNNEIYFLGAGHLGIKAVSFFEIENFFLDYYQEQQFIKVNSDNNFEFFCNILFFPY